MKHFILLTALFAYSTSLTGAEPTQKDVQAEGSSARVVDSFDKDWKFFKGDDASASFKEFDDAAWRTLDVPHDWSIEGPFDAKNPTGGAGGFLPGGVGWYRKLFTVPIVDYGKRIFVEFDGVMANSEVWINGRSLGKRPNGYVGLRYEITDDLRYGENEKNVLAVRADNSQQPASRWYTGAGIYRHVRLIVVSPVYIEKDSLFVTTPSVSSDKTTIHVSATVVNRSDAAYDVSVAFSVVAPDGKVVERAETAQQGIAEGKSGDYSSDITVKKPLLWNLDDPKLYKIVATVQDKEKKLDEETATFGIRSVEFKPTSGFWLNGSNIKILGVCLHHDAGAFGAAVPLRAWERRLENLKKIGINGIRTAHNPVAPEFLDLCDRMGFVVMDEFFDCWLAGKTPHDYHKFFTEWSKIDMRDVIRHDRNHPSVVLYSVGNEIHDTSKPDKAKEILKALIETCHETDPTRPVTQALFRPNVTHDFDNGLADMLDVIGTNYRDVELLKAQEDKPTRKIINTEQGQDRKNWLNQRDNPPLAGQFLWTGIDYLGESRTWPMVAAGCGLLDLTGEPKTIAFERQSWWNNKPMVYAVRRVGTPKSSEKDAGGFGPLNPRQTQFADWTPEDLVPHEETVDVFSNAEEVELFLNGKSLGVKSREDDEIAPLSWKVPFEPSILQAVAKKQGEIVARHELRTAGKPDHLLLAVDRPKLTNDWNDVAYVTATVVDEKGTPCPRAENVVQFKIDGPGVLAGVENGDRFNHEPFQSIERAAYQGRCVALVQAKASKGQITLTATSPELKAGSAAIDAAAGPFVPNPGNTKTDSTSSAISSPTAVAPPVALPKAIDPRLPTLWLIGDSTVKNGSGKGADGLWGWGNAIGAYFDLGKINVVNRALGGRSSRTYRTEGLWEKVLADVKPGDFVMMQFGHNDGGPIDNGKARASLKGTGDESREVTLESTGKNETVYTYGWYMKNYCAEAKEKKAIPIVLSPVPRNIWTDGKVNRASEDYGGWAADSAKAQKAFFIDLNEIISKRYEADGQEIVASRYFTTKDHTHTTDEGARVNAACVVEGLRALKDCPLSKLLLPESQTKDLEKKPLGEPAKATNTSYKFFFGTQKTESGWIAVTPKTVYSAKTGYGFDFEPADELKKSTKEKIVKKEVDEGSFSSNQPFNFSVGLPEGNYDVTVAMDDENHSVATVLKAESRRLMLEEVAAEARGYATRTFTVNVRTPEMPGGDTVKLKPREIGPPLSLDWDEKLTLEFNGSRPTVSSIMLDKNDTAVTIFLAGDSTVTDQPAEPWASWGQMLPCFFKRGVAVANHAESGESLKSFFAEKRAEKIFGTMKKGDYLLIQFGHNDQKEQGKPETVLASYRANLKKMIDETRQRGAYPVLITPMHRLRFDVAGKIVNTLGEFPEAVRQTAAEEKVPLIDLNAMSKTLYEALGPKEAQKAFQDATHHTNYGAYELAKCVVEGLRANNLELGRFLTADGKKFDPAEPDPFEKVQIPPTPGRSTAKPEGN